MTILKGSHVTIHVECCEVRELKSLVIGCLNGNGYMCKSGLWDLKLYMLTKDLQ